LFIFDFSIEFLGSNYKNILGYDNDLQYVMRQTCE